MADSNNAFTDKIPLKPSPALKTLSPLLGVWSVGGPYITGTIQFEWLDGEYFLTQKVDLLRDNHQIKGVEYIGFDEDSQTLRSHFMDNSGHNFTYTWEIEGNKITTWFGDKGSNNYFEGHFSEDGNMYSGKWQWPGGGYEATMRKT